MFYDVIANRSEFLRLSDPEVYETLSNMFPDRNLYCHSQDWRDSDKYHLKAKGGRGDVLVGWGNVTKEDEESERTGSLRCITLESILGHQSKSGTRNQGPSGNRK